MSDAEEFRILPFPEMPEKVAAAIQRQLPGVSIDEIEGIAGAFALIPMLELTDPASERQRLESIGKIASELAELLTGLGPGSRGVIREQLAAHGGPTFKALRIALGIASATATDLAGKTTVPRGRPNTPKRYLVSQLAHVLKKAGYPVNAKQQGHLVYLTAEVLTWLLGHPGDVRSLVRNTLRS